MIKHIALLILASITFASIDIKAAKRKFTILSPKERFARHLDQLKKAGLEVEVMHGAAKRITCTLCMRETFVASNEMLHLPKEVKHFERCSNTGKNA